MSVISPILIIPKGFSDVFFRYKQIFIYILSKVADGFLKNKKVKL